MDKFNLHNQFEEWLVVVKLDKTKMPKVQYEEMKLAFFAGCGQMLKILYEDIAKVPTDVEAAEIVQGLYKQVGEFYFNMAQQRFN